MMEQDHSKLYKITYKGGQVRYGNRRTLANVLGHQSHWKSVTLVEVAPMPADFTDVTAGFKQVRNG